MSAAPPGPAALVHLGPTDRHGWAVTIGAISVTGVALWLSSGGWPAWIAGQLLLGLALVAWFAILHECGHRTLFRRRRLNTLIGLAAGVMTLIPFRCWTRVHGRHHKWTGWQDLDPTTEALVPRTLSRFERTAIDLCWRLWIPIFSVLYRLQNFWSPRRLAAIFPGSVDRRPMLVNAVMQALFYVAIAVMLDPWTIGRYVGLGIVVSLVAEDLLLLSQHTHVPQHVSQGRSVPPVPAIDQEPFTRSLRLPSWVSALLLHVDAHELHHMYPFVPGYHLRRIPYQPSNEVGWLAWVRASRRLPGTVLLFQNRHDTGFPL